MSDVEPRKAFRSRSAFLHAAIYLLTAIVANVLFAYIMGHDANVASPTIRRIFNAYGAGSLVFWIVVLGAISYVAGLRMGRATPSASLSIVAAITATAAAWAAIVWLSDVALMGAILLLPALLGIGARYVPKAPVYPIID